MPPKHHQSNCLHTVNGVAGHPETLRNLIGAESYLAPNYRFPLNAEAAETQKFAEEMLTGDISAALGDLVAAALKIRPPIRHSDVVC